jgi:hypothetical protein
VNDLITQAEKATVPALLELNDHVVDFRFGSGTAEQLLATGTWTSDVMNEAEEVIGFISRAYKGQRHYTVLCWSDMRLSFSCDGSDVVVRGRDSSLGTIRRFRPGNWSYESEELGLAFKTIFWSLSKAALSFRDAASFRIRYGDGCLLSKDLNSYLLLKGGKMRKMTVALILYARSFQSSM